MFCQTMQINKAVHYWLLKLITNLESVNGLVPANMDRIVDFPTPWGPTMPTTRKFVWSTKIWRQSKMPGSHQCSRKISRNSIFKEFCLCTFSAIYCSFQCFGSEGQSCPWTRLLSGTLYIQVYFWRTTSEKACNQISITSQLDSGCLSANRGITGICLSTHRNSWENVFCCLRVCSQQCYCTMVF